MKLQDRINKVQESLYNKGERVQKIVDATYDEMVSPGLYEVFEYDHGGMYTNTIFKFQLNTPMNLKEIALVLIEDKNYLPAWGYLTIRSAKPAKYYTIG